MRRYSILLACVVLAASSGAAQSPPSQSEPSSAAPVSANPPAQASVPGSSSQKEKELERQEQSQRTLGVLPQFLVTSRQNAPPLTSHQKFHLFVKQAFDPVEFAVTAAQAGISQAQDEFHGYGQGAEGYAKRYGAAFGDATSSGFWSNFFYPTLFKQDPRYFRLGQGSFKHRVVHSMKEEFVCHTDKGGRSFSYSNVLGALTAGGISNAYYPRDDRGLGLTMSRVGIALAYGTLGGLFDEFGPDIHHKLLHRHQKNSQKP